MSLMLTAAPESTYAAPRALPPDAPVLVAGTGSVGARHLRNLRRLGHERVVLLRTGLGPAGAATPDEVMWPVRRSTERTLADALAHAPAAAIVANPTALHLDTAVALAEAGCHVLVEKPLAHDAHGLRRLRAAVAEHGVALLVGYQLRFHPTLARVREWIADGAVGAVVSAHAHWGEYLPGWHPGEEYRAGYSARRDLGGGAVLTLSHPFDYLRWILGEVAAVSAMTARRAGLGLDVEDTAAVTLRMASGALATVYVDYAEHPPRHTLHVVGTRGTIAWDAADGVARLVRDGSRAPIEVRPPAAFVRNDLFVAELRHFLACAVGAESPRCALHDGERALLVALAALRSAEEGRTIDV